MFIHFQCLFQDLNDLYLLHLLSIYAWVSTLHYSVAKGCVHKLVILFIQFNKLEAGSRSRYGVHKKVTIRSRYGVVHKKVTIRSRYSVVHKKVTIRSRYGVVHKKVTIRSRYGVVHKKVTIRSR